MPIAGPSDSISAKESASSSKLRARGFVDTSDEDSSDVEGENDSAEDFQFYGEGYRLVDLECLADFLANIHRCQDGMSHDFVKCISECRPVYFHYKFLHYYL